MLKNVRSPIIMKLLFSFLKEKQKLIFAKYNKYLQKKLNISIINYMNFMGKYIIYQSKGKGKEYYGYDDKLIFEGEYSHGERNGKGKEYGDNDNLIFEGEYKNGKRNGKGKEYYNNAKLKFESKYLNDVEWNGKGYDEFNKVIYELKNGDGIINVFKRCYTKYLNVDKKENRKMNEYDEDSYLLKYKGGKLLNQRNGNGKLYYKGKLIFEGEYLYDCRINGKEYINGKLTFEGEYRYNKKWNGKGYDEKGNVIYELINGNGKVKEYSDYGELIYEGEYLNGKRYGIGKGKEYNLKDNVTFEGEYLNGKRHGKGKEYDVYGGLIFNGEYLNGKRNVKEKR